MQCLCVLAKLTAAAAAAAAFIVRRGGGGAYGGLGQFYRDSLCNGVSVERAEEK